LEWPTQAKTGLKWGTERVFFQAFEDLVGYVLGAYVVSVVGGWGGLFLHVQVFGLGRGGSMAFLWQLRQKKWGRRSGPVFNVVS
jgi:hypothetical protein